MNSNILNSIGLGNIDIGIIFAVLAGISVFLLILVIVAFVQISSFKKKYNKFMQGKDGKSLEEDVVKLYEDNQYIKEHVDNNSELIKELFEKHKSTFQKIGLVKYDAFKEMGGKLSFAITLLDENNDGFIINSVHSSEGCYSYTKRVINGDSQIALSNEEKVAVERAMGVETNSETE